MSLLQRAALCASSMALYISLTTLNNNKLMIIKERIPKPDGSIRFRNYLKQQKLGKGGFADCFKVERMEDKKSFALKIINKSQLEKPKAKQKMHSEIGLHKIVKHKNICQLQRVFEDEQNVYMMLELCPSGNMFELIKKRKKLTIPETQYFVYQLIDALCYLHNKQIIHRDIKLGNLLINQKVELKLADFGLATKLQYVGDRKHTVCGTPNYIAPQVILSSMGLGISGHSYEVDVWSTGVIMYLMLIGKAPFETQRIEKTYQRISRAEFDFPQWFKDSSAKDLLRRILVTDVSKRLTFEQILAHQFMNPKQGIPKEIPISCLTTAPKFENKYEKLESSDIKESARNFSINTLRSEVDLSMDENFEGLPSFKKRDPRSKDIKGLLKTVFSDRPLSRSLQKLAVIGRSTSPQAKQPTNPFSNTASKQKISLRERSITNVQTKTSPHTYIITFKKEIILSYLLSTGYIGTYDPNYKLLYNKTQNLYFQAQGQNELKRLKSQNIPNNENIQNRKKFIRFYYENHLECEPFLSTSRLVYLIRTFQVKSQNAILFKFSNNNFQIFLYDLDKTLLITQSQLILVTIKQGMQMNKHVENRQNYVESKNKDLISLYLKFKKISSQMKK